VWDQVHLTSFAFYQTLRPKSTMQFNGRMMLLVAALFCSSVAASGGDAAAPSAVRKVVTLLEDMKSQVQKDAADDTAAYDKYACWCETNKKVKNEAVDDANKKITELEAVVEESAASQGQLKSEIEGLEADIAADKESLEEATAIRAKENEAFVAASDEMSEAIAALTEAVEVLSKVNLLQKKGHGVSSPKLRLQLLQVKDTLKNIHSKNGMFRNVMQKDFFDVMSVLGGSASGSFLGHGPVLAQQPKPKSEEELGKEAKPNDLTGLASGAKSYNSRSGEIYGLLKEMLEEFERDLAEAKATEAAALKMFNDLKASKLAEIAAAEAQIKAKSAELAAAIQAEAQAKEDIESTTKALTADEQFLLTLAENCKTADEEYASRVKARDEEITALTETITILTGDEARALFGKTLSFLQINKKAAVDSAARSRMMASAAKRLMRTARKSHNWLLASLVVRMKLDPFTKVKAMMDKMSADLKAEQQAEYEKNEYCLKVIDETEDSIKVATNEKKDLTTLKVKLEGDISMYTSEIATLEKQVADDEVALKVAGEERKAANMVYQQSVSDQRATIHVLTMAYDRLKVFYTASMVQVATPPPMGTGAYEKSGHGGSVLQMVADIIQDAKDDEIILVGDEQQSQKDYAKFAADTTASIEADKESILEKTKLLEKSEGLKAETEGSLLTNGEELSELESTLSAHHADCDWLMKYFDVRQTARTEEIEAIAEAKAILSGASFGEALEAGASAS